MSTITDDEGWSSRRKFLVGVGATVAAGVWGESTTAFADTRNRTEKFSGTDYRIPNRKFNVKNYGAVGDGDTQDTEAFESAIAAAHRAGGGRVIVPAGVYLTGAIHLRSNVDLHVRRDATIRFSQDPNDYLPMVHTRDGGVELYNYSPFIYAYKERNIALTGNGTLDGNADKDHWWPWADKKQASKDREALLDMARNHVPVGDRKFGEGHYIRPVMIEFYNCRNVHVTGLTIQDAANWHVHPVLSENVVIQHVNIEGHGPNNDGVDPESSTNVMIRESTFDTGDDCIAIKSGRGPDGRLFNIPSQNIYVIGNHMKDGHGGITLGSEMTGGVQNVVARKNTLDSPRLWNALRIKSNPERGGYVKDVTFTGNTVKTVKEDAIRVNTNYGNVTSGDHIPKVEGVVISNFESSGGDRPMRIEGLEKSPIKDVRVTKSRFDHTDKGPRLENVENVTFDNVFVNGERYVDESG